MKSVYLFLSGTKTPLARLVCILTASRTTHSSFSLDTKFDNMYSFGRLGKKPFPAGFANENIRKNIFEVYKNCPCKVFQIDLTDEGYDKLLARLNYYKENAKDFKYNFFGAYLCSLRFKGTTPKNKRFCSQFVSELLNEGGIKLPYKPSLMRPRDFLKVDTFKEIYHGSIENLCRLSDEGKI